VGIAYKLNDATEVAPTLVPAETVGTEWSVEITGLTEGTTYQYYAYAKVGDAEPVTGGTKTFTTKTISDADISVDFTAAATYPADFPAGTSSAAQKELKTYSFAGYDFAFYGAENGYYRANSSEPHYLMLGKQGAYLELPAVAGKSLSKIIVKSRDGASTNVKVSVCDTSDAVVEGGAEQLWDNTSDYTYVYNLSGTAMNTPYRLYIANAYNAQITQLDLYYTEGGAIALSPKTTELTFEPDETAAKTVEYTFDAETGALTVAIDSDQYFTAELDADGKTVKVTPKSANDSDAARTATVTVTLTDKTDASRTATATISVTHKSATPQPIDTVIAGGTGKDAFVEGVIVAKNTKGFILKDDTGVVYIYLNDVVPQNIGDKVQVKGTTYVRNGVFQIQNNPAVTFVETASYTPMTPEQMTASEIDAYVGETSFPVKYVQYKGVLTNSGSYYNVEIDGTAVQGSIQNPPATLNLPAIIGAPVVVTGYTVGKSTSGGTTFFNTMATSVEVDPSAPATITKVDPSSLSWANDDTAAQTVTVKGVNLSGITWTLSGAGSSHFTVSEGASTTTGAITTIELTVTPTAPNMDAEGITGTLTVQATGSDSKKEIALEHKKMSSGNQLVVTLETKEGSGLPTVQDQTKESSVTIGSYTWGTFNVKQNSQYLMIYGNSGYVATPAISGKTLQSVVVTTSGTISSSAAVTIKSADGAVVSAEQLVGAQKNTPFTFDLIGATENTSYRINSSASKNTQLVEIKLIYE